MESDSFGSFSIVLRLAQQLNASTASPDRCERILKRFVTLFSNAPGSLHDLFDALFGPDLHADARDAFRNGNFDVAGDTPSDDDDADDGTSITSIHRLVDPRALLVWSPVPQLVLNAAAAVASPSGACANPGPGAEQAPPPALADADAQTLHSACAIATSDSIMEWERAALLLCVTHLLAADAAPSAVERQQHVQRKIVKLAQEVGVTLPPQATAATATNANAAAVTPAARLALIQAVATSGRLYARLGAFAWNEVVSFCDTAVWSASDEEGEGADAAPTKAVGVAGVGISTPGTSTLRLAQVLALARAVRRHLRMGSTPIPPAATETAVGNLLPSVSFIHGVPALGATGPTVPVLPVTAPRALLSHAKHVTRTTTGNAVSARAGFEAGYVVGSLRARAIELTRRAAGATTPSAFGTSTPFGIGTGGEVLGLKILSALASQCAYAEWPAVLRLLLGVGCLERGTPSQEARRLGIAALLRTLLADLYAAAGGADTDAAASVLARLDRVLGVRVPPSHAVAVVEPTSASTAPPAPPPSSIRRRAPVTADNEDNVDEDDDTNDTPAPPKPRLAAAAAIAANAAASASAAPNAAATASVAKRQPVPTPAAAYVVPTTAPLPHRLRAPVPDSDDDDDGARRFAAPIAAAAAALEDEGDDLWADCDAAAAAASRPPMSPRLFAESIVDLEPVPPITSAAAGTDDGFGADVAGLFSDLFPPPARVRTAVPTGAGPAILAAPPGPAFPDAAAAHRRARSPATAAAAGSPDSTAPRPTVTPTAAVATPPAAAHHAAAKPAAVPCMYGMSCRRNNPAHFVQFSHPRDHPRAVTLPPALPSAPDADAATAGYPTKPPLPPPPAPPAAPAAAVASVEHPSAQAIGGVAPLHYMRPHEFVTMGAWRIKFCGDGTGTYCCNCPPWRFQTTPTNKRTCKHLQLYLGAAFETKRCAPDLDEFVDGAGVGYGAAAAATAAPGAPIGGAAPRAMAGAAFGGKKAIPGVLLAQKADEKGDYTGWWCSEKLDGVRGYWDGTTLVSRNGGVFHAPEWFTRSLPKDCTLDGEIFGGRKQFQRTVGVVRSGPGHVGWKNLTFQVFDIPSEGRVPFERRMELVKQKIIENMPPELAATAEARGGVIPAAHHVQLVAQEKCTSRADLDRRLRAVEAAGGEGLMLRQPGSAYVHARSATLLKVKSFEEVEAIVRGYDTGKGRLAGAVGALRAELANGKQFAVGSGLTDALRARPPRVGAIITVKFQELTDAGIPRFPVFIGERIDAVWPPPLAAAAH